MVMQDNASSPKAIRAVASEHARVLASAVNVLSEEF
jgi:hypothetical protein